MNTIDLTRNLKVRTTLKFILILFLFTSCKFEPKKELKTELIPKELKRSISISGADALYPLMKIWAEEFSEDNSSIKIEVSNIGTEKGLDQLLSGHVDLY